MGTALSVILLIVLVLAVGLARDSMRTGAVTRWAQAHGFSRVPREEQDSERLMAWAGRFRPDSAAQWGIVLRGETAGLETIIAEHDEKRYRRAARWHTLAITRVPGLQIDAVRITTAEAAATGVVRSVIDATTAPGRAARDLLGIEVTERPVLHPVGRGKWAVEAVNADALAFWLSDTQAAAIDGWPHDAELAAVDDYVLVRVPGLIAAARLDDLLAAAEAARSLFVPAARDSKNARS